MSVDLNEGQLHVVIVGGGFAGVGCARRLAGRDDVRITLIDRNNYHQFQPLLYQVATSQLASSDIAYSLRKLFHDHINVDVKLAEVAAVDTATHTVTTTDGDEFTGDALVIAAGAEPNFFRTVGAAEHTFPLYSLDDAQRLRSRSASSKTPMIRERRRWVIQPMTAAKKTVPVAAAVSNAIVFVTAVPIRGLFKTAS